MPSTPPPLDLFDGWLANLSDQDLVATTLLGEARGEDRLGREMVASVLMTRVGIAKAHFQKIGAPYWWGSSPREVILKPFQFDCWLEDDPNRGALMTFPRHPLWPEALEIAEAALSGTLGDKARGATHYLNPRTVRRLPTWATDANKVATHLHHTFFRVV